MLENLNWNTETILILGIVTFVAFALLGLVIWNSKTNKQVKTLISIDDSLKHLETAEPAGPSTTPATHVDNAEAEQTQQEEPTTIVEEIKEPPNQVNIGRSGRVYTKEELEVQIR